MARIGEVGKPGFAFAESISCSPVNADVSMAKMRIVVVRVFLFTVIC